MSLTAVFVQISLLILLFQVNIEAYVTAINYYDEFFALILFVIYLVRKKGKLGKDDMVFLFSLIMLIVVGLVGNARSGININVFIDLVDALGVIKIFLVFLSVTSVLTECECEKISYIIAVFFQIYILVAAFFLILAYMIKDISWMFTQVRFGIGTYGFIAGAGGLGYYLMAAYCLFEMEQNRLRWIKQTKILCIILILSTLKGIAFLFIGFLFFFKMAVKWKKMKWYHVIMIIISGIIVGWWQIKTYLLNTTTARAQLNITAIKIARDFFPTGSGLATYGCEMSRRYYSAIYFRYGLSRVYGLSETFGMYINDNYWAMIVGQFGFICAVMLAWRYFQIFKNINNKSEVMITTKFAMLSMFFAIMGGSIGAAYLTNSIGVMCFTIVGLYTNRKWTQYVIRR